MNLTSDQQQRLEWMKNVLGADTISVQMIPLSGLLMGSVLLPNVVIEKGSVVALAPVEPTVFSDLAVTMWTKRVAVIYFQADEEEWNHVYSMPKPRPAPKAVLGRPYPYKAGSFSCLSHGSDEIAVGEQAEIGGVIYNKIAFPMPRTPFGSGYVILWEPEPSGE